METVSWDEGYSTPRNRDSPTAWERTFIEKISDVQIQVVAPQDGL